MSSIDVLGLMLKNRVKKYKWRYIDNKEASNFHRQHPLAVSEKWSHALDELRRDGITTFHMEDLAGGLELFEKMTEEFKVSRTRAEKEVLAKQALLDQGADQAKLMSSYIVAMYPWQRLPMYKTILVQLALHPEILALVNTYMQMTTRIMSMAYWQTLVSPNKLQFSNQYWHRDFEDIQLVKVFVYLNDVDEGTGPFEYIKGTHRGIDRWKWPRNSNDTTANDEGLWQVYAPERKRTVTGRKGTVFIADTKGCHKGGWAFQRVRQSCFIGYKSPSYTRKSLFAPIEGLPENLHPAIEFAGLGG